MDWKAVEEASGYSVFTRDYDQVAHIRDLLLDDATIEENSGPALALVEAVRQSKSALDIRASAEAFAARAGGRGAAVTILVDNSGSLRGVGIVAAAVTAAIAAYELERAGIATEVLGYTTRSWKGGQARERWIDAGRPMKPGRLSETRHIVYKEAASTGFGESDFVAVCAMCSNRLLKDNLDNEALAWAADRLLARPEAEKVLLLITDSPSPICDATASIDFDVLKRHHAAVVEAIENEGSIALGTVFIEDRWNIQADDSPYRRYRRSGEYAEGVLHGARPEAVMSAAASMLEEMLLEHAPARRLG